MGGMMGLGAFGRGDVESLKDVPWQVDTENPTKFFLQIETPSHNLHQEIDAYNIVKKNDKGMLTTGEMMPFQTTDYNREMVPQKFCRFEVIPDPKSTPSLQQTYILNSVKFWSSLKDPHNDLIAETIKDVEQKAFVKERALTTKDLIGKGTGQTFREFMSSLLGKKLIMTKMDFCTNTFAEYRM